MRLDSIFIKNIKKLIKYYNNLNKHLDLTKTFWYKDFKAAIDNNYDGYVDRSCLESIEELKYLCKLNFIRPIKLIRIDNNHYILIIIPNSDLCLQNKPIVFCLNKLSAEDFICDSYLFKLEQYHIQKRRNFNVKYKRIKLSME